MTELIYVEFVRFLETGRTPSTCMTGDAVDSYFNFLMYEIITI